MAPTGQHQTERAEPGSTGEGEYYRIVLRPSEQFVTFRTHDVGEKGHLLRVAGQREDGSWETQAWLVSKEDAHMEGNKLAPDAKDAEELLADLGSEPKHLKGDIFVAKERRGVLGRAKPSRPQRRTRMSRIQKAESAR